MLSFKLIPIFIITICLIFSINLFGNNHKDVPHKKPGMVLNINDKAKNTIVRLYCSNFFIPVSRTYASINNYMMFCSRNVTTHIKTSGNVLFDLANDNEEIDIKIYLKKVHNLTICGNGRTKIFLFYDSTSVDLNDIQAANSIKIVNASLVKAILPKIGICSLKFENSSINYLNLKNAVISKYFSIKNSALDSSNFNSAVLPPILFIDKVKLTRVGSIDFTNLQNLRNTIKEPALELERVIKINETDLDRLKLNYDRFSFHVDSAQDFQHRIWIYQKILKHMSAEGLTVQYGVNQEKYIAICDSINHKPITNWVNIGWWNKGHNKTKVIMYCLYIFLIFIILNLLMINFLKTVYYPKSFKIYFKLKRKKYGVYCQGKILTWQLRSAFYLFWYNLCGSILYTTFVFWGLKLNMDELKFGNLWLVCYIILQYITGLLFVAYIISFIIIRL